MNQKHTAILLVYPGNTVPLFVHLLVFFYRVIYLCSLPAQRAFACSAALAQLMPFPSACRRIVQTGTGYFSSLSARGTSVGCCVSEAAFARMVFVESCCNSSSLWTEGRCLHVSPDLCMTSGPAYHLRQGDFFQVEQTKGSLFSLRDKGTYLHIFVRPSIALWYVRRASCCVRNEVQFPCFWAEKSTEEENSVK